MFQFKQFSVDQSGCAMKINTDGVLLGAIAEADNPSNILDIGTGTGVIALMLAQRFAEARVDAVEIDLDAAKTAERNFNLSPFKDRLTVYASGFESYFEQFPGKRYDLIVSNPPFYLSSLKSPGAKRTLAKHTDIEFFERLLRCISNQLSPGGCCWLMLLFTFAETIIALAESHCVYPRNIINVHSFSHSIPHRVIICFGTNEVRVQITKLTIYKAVSDYSEEYQKLLQPYFIAF
jgi:tRNA1Val (adenine37-N6)-methyltransferase